MNAKSPRPLGGTHEDNCSSIQQPHFQCVLKVRMAASLMALCIAVLQVSSMESRPPDADNLSRGNIGAVEELQALFPQPSLLQFTYADFDAVVHFATVAYMSERNTLMLLDAMKAHKVKILIYSSTCATYGEPKRDANHRRYTAGKLKQDLQLGSN
ncbi:unnamed protein product [Sphagnum troendelagicum]|uniref:NAD-dependent epimerase/dehydratase domain-containing protein n=1 Tax=Sphagnum troendelagicum TaxID=128251 RepID=A0ABP0TG35_9BRYO